MTWIVTAYGASRSEKSVSSWFSKKAQKAGVPPGKTAHGSRKLRDMLIAENEGTPNQCMSWLGHETLAEATRYTKKYDRRRALTDKTGEQKAFNRVKKFQLIIESYNSHERKKKKHADAWIKGNQSKFDSWFK